MVITDQTFQQEVEDFDGVVLIDFWAEWCTPCKIIQPTVEEIAKEYEGNANVKIAKLNVDENPMTAQKFGVMSIPTLLIFKQGKPAKAVIGLQPKDVIVDALQTVSAM